MHLTEMILKFNIRKKIEKGKEYYGVIILQTKLNA